jgi:hypothetical protein
MTDIIIIIVIVIIANDSLLHAKLIKVEHALRHHTFLSSSWANSVCRVGRTPRTSSLRP